MSKTPNKTIVFVREPGVVVPEAYLRKVLAACPSGGGYAVQSKNEAGEPCLITDNTDSGGDLEGVQELLKGYASHRILLAFNKLEKVEEKLLQPYHVAIDGDDVLLSFGIDGHFPSMVEAGTTQESLLAHRVMFPNLQRLIKFSGGDLDKFIAELRDPTFTEMVMSRVGDRGAFCFLPPVGEPFWLGKNTAGSTFPWGQTSDTLGYTETPAASEVAPAEVKKGWWGKSKGPAVPVAQEASPQAPVAPAAPPPGPLNLPADKPDTKIKPPEITPSAAPTSPPEGEWKEIPKGLSKDQRKKLIRRVTNCGSILPDHWNSDPFWYWEAKYPKNEAMVMLAHKETRPKDMRQAAPKPVAPKSGGEIDILMMDKNERSAIETHILNVLGYNAKNIKTPLEVQEIESRYAKFSDDFGVKLDVINNWTPKQLRLLGPKGMAHLLIEYRRMVIEGKAAGSPPAEQSTEAPAKVAASSSDPAPKGFWGKKKVA